MDIPPRAEERYRSGRGKGYCAFHKVQLQIPRKKWPMPAYHEYLEREEEETKKLIKTHRVLYTEDDVQAFYQEKLDTLLPHAATFGASGPVNMSNTETYWLSDNEEAFEHFFSRTKPDTVIQLPGSGLIVVEYKSPWPPNHNLSTISFDLELRLLGQLVRQMCAYRTKFGIVSTVEETRFCQLVQSHGGSEDDWELWVSDVIPWGDKGNNISKHLKAFLHWVGGQSAELKMADSSWVISISTATLASKTNTTAFEAKLKHGGEEGTGKGMKTKRENEGGEVANGQIDRPTSRPKRGHKTKGGF